MTSFDRFERSLPELFDELAMPRTPDYFDDILTRTAATRQRPGWSFPERWLPMSALTRRLAAAPRIPWRLAAAVALLVVTAIIGVLLAGSQEKHLPAPFGLAGNGQIVFADPAGKVVAGDPVTGETRILIAELGNGRPVYSPDGSRLAFTRSSGGMVDLMVADADGSHVRAVTQRPIVAPRFMAWSPAGDVIAITHYPGILELYQTSRPAAPTILGGKLPVSKVAVGYDGLNDRAATLFRPPSGDELLFVNYADGVKLSAVKPDGTGYRDLINTSSALGYSELKSAQWSPDGQQVVVMVEFPVEQDRWHLYVLNADGTGLRPLSDLSRDPQTDEGSPMWSPDSTRIAFMRWTVHADGSGQDFHPLAVVDVATGALRDAGRVSFDGYSSYEWSPDGTSILAAPGDGSRDLLVIDAATGKWTKAAWSVDTAVSWQRTALP